MLCLAPPQRFLQLNSSVLPGMLVPTGDLNTTKRWRARKAAPGGLPTKGNDFLQSAQEIETRHYSLTADKAPMGTPLNKICHREKKHCWKMGTQRLPAPEGYTHVCNHPHWWCICISGKMPLPDPMGTIPQPVAAPCQQIHQAHKTSDEINTTTPEVLPHLTETLLPIAGPGALLCAPQHTRVHGPSPARPGRGCHPAACRILPFTGAACSNLGGLALGTEKLRNTNDTLRYTTLAQLLLSRLSFQQTLSLKSLETGGWWGRGSTQ